MEIKDILKAKRIQKEMTMKELADKVGVSEGTISRWESGDIANMKRDKIVSLADALEISPLTIMGIDAAAQRKKDLQEIARKAMEEYDALQKMSPEIRELIDKYRAADPGTQRSVRKLLDIEEDHLLPVAAHAHEDASPEELASDVDMLKKAAEKKRGN